jgi:hypothetical protein
MTYSMYSLVDSNLEALLDLSTLQNLVNKCFSTFFQHLVSSNISLETGSWAYQPINAGLPPDLGLSINSSNQPSEVQDVLHPISNTSRSIPAPVSTEIELLHINRTAF